MSRKNSKSLEFCGYCLGNEGFQDFRMWVLEIISIIIWENLTCSIEKLIRILLKTVLKLRKNHNFFVFTVSRRNARERNRVKQVNNGFSTLRTHIPHLKNKTSKVDTLRAAVDYIRALRNLMGEPLMEEHMHQGPVLISEMEEAKM